MGRSEAMRIAKPQERVVQNIEHQPRLGTERPLFSIKRHVVLGPGQEAAALAARLRLAGLQSDRRIIILVEMAFIDHPADHSAQRRSIDCPPATACAPSSPP
jgi:hypothetical protein